MALSTKIQSAIEQFLSGKSFTSCNGARTQFKLATQLDISYHDFAKVYQTMQAEGKMGDASKVKTIKIAEREKVEYVNIEEIREEFTDDLITPIKSDTCFDNLISVYGGVLPATVTIAPGESGVGKTTVLLDYLGKIKKKKENKKLKICFISGEMNKIHLYKYQKRVKFENVDIVLLGEYERPDHIIEDVANQGYDIILLDSFQDAVNKVTAECAMGAKEAEKWLLKVMDQSRMGKNQRKVYTAWICTQHLTKGAEYAGSTNLKHMTDAMMMMKKEGTLKYIEFCKNRDGDVGTKLFFEITSEGIDYNQERFESEVDAKNTVKGLIEDAKNGNEVFTAFLRANKNTLAIAEETK